MEHPHLDQVCAASMLEVEQLLQGPSLRLRDAHQRRESDELVAPAELGHKLFWCGPSLAHTEQELGHVFGAWRRAIRHQHNTGRTWHQATTTSARMVSAWTSSTSRFRLSAGVSASTPWPRLKMWPGRPAARSNTLRASRSMTSQGASRTAGSRLPWMPLSNPMRRHASSRGRRQSTLTTWPPAAAISSSR